MTEQIRILLADDHRVLRQGMAQALDAQPDMCVVAQANNGVEAVQLVSTHRPDVALVDINMPEMDGVEATRRITAVSPQTAIIILTMYRHGDYVVEAIKAGASGYLLKEVELEEVLAAIRAVARGEAVMDPVIAGRVLAELRSLQSVETQPSEPQLSARDAEILRLLAKGLSNQEIARHLHIAEKTVRNRLSLIYRNLDLENRTQAALYALREGLIEPQEPKPSSEN
ncbi:MAG: response regulator [Chloroflexi bacterium]|jgi:DNA-binding NarL/FixJ family response regulator|nr:response regulator [Chloroflexota bacterium]